MCAGRGILGCGGVGGWGGGNFEPGLEKREQKSNTM